MGASAPGVASISRECGAASASWNGRPCCAGWTGSIPRTGT